MLHIDPAHLVMNEITAEDLDAIVPSLDRATVDDLAFRLSGLSGPDLELGCVRLADAMLDDMRGLGYAMGRLEHVVVLALLRAAVDKFAFTTVGHA